MPKFYVRCGDIRVVTDAENPFEAAKRAVSDIDSLIDGSVSVAETILVCERGFRENPGKDVWCYDTLKAIKGLYE